MLSQFKTCIMIAFNQKCEFSPRWHSDSRISFRHFRIPFPFKTFKQSKLFSNFLSLLEVIVLKFKIEGSKSKLGNSRFFEYTLAVQQRI